MAAEDQIAEAKSRIESLLAPINGGVGEDISYDDGFEKVKGEVDKLQSIEGSKPDWGTVVSMADELLSDKSKDYRVALYYAAGKAQLDGLQGVLDGLVLCHELAQTFWDDMYPPLRRARLRGNLVAWYSDVSGPAMAPIQPTAKDRDLVMAIDEVSKALDADLREKLADSYAGIEALRDACRNLVRITPEEAPPPPPPPPPGAPAEAAPAAPAAAASAVSAPSAADVTDAESAMGALGDCSLTLTRCGDALRMEDATDAQAYRVARVGNWLMLNEAPNNEGGRTSIPAPPEHVAEGLDALFKAGDWQGLLAAADEAGNEHIAWLDPQRHVANALERLGGKYARAKRAMLVECALLLLRVPELPNLSFDDDTPLADGATKMWLETDVEPLFASSGGGGGGGQPSYIDGPLKEAKGLVAEGELAQAVDLLCKAAAAAPSPSDAFQTRVELANMCIQGEQFAIARAHLEGLDQVVDRFQLMEWDPILCSKLYAALYAAHRGANVGDEIDPDLLKREQQAFARLCQLDAAEAVRLGAQEPSE